MGAAGILDERQQYTSHVRENNAAFRDRGPPLYFDGVRAIDPLRGILLGPADQRDAGVAGIVNDPECLATSQSNRGVPAAGDLFAADDRVRRDRRAVQGSRFRQACWRYLLSRRPKLFVASPVALGNLLLGLWHRHAPAPALKRATVIVKCASTSFPALPSMGRMPCGHPENAITRCISARGRS